MSVVNENWMKYHSRKGDRYPNPWVNMKYPAIIEMMLSVEPIKVEGIH